MNEQHEPNGWVLVTVGVGTLVSALDSSIVNVILPVLRTDLHTTVAGIEWVVTVYLLAVSALLLVMGRAGDLYGQKRLYISGFVLFVGGSMLCGMAPNVASLVALRCLQAIGASMLFSSSPAILTKSFPAHLRGRVLGAQGTMTCLGLTIGPPLGGWIAQQFGWRWVFYVNVPVGALAVALAAWSVRDDRSANRPEPFDFVGAALFGAGLVALLLGLNKGGEWGWGSASTLGTLATGTVVLGAFARVELVRSSPMLDLTLFRTPVFSAAAASALLNYVCVNSLLFVMPFLLIQGLRLGTQASGLVLAAQPVVMAIVAPVSGALSDRLGSRMLATLGMALVAVGLSALGMLASSGSIPLIVGGLMVVGLGEGIFVSPNNSALMGAAPKNRQGIASGVLATARNVGMALGVGLAGAVFTTVLSRDRQNTCMLTEGVHIAMLGTSAIAVIGMVVCTVQSRYRIRIDNESDRVES